MEAGFFTYARFECSRNCWLIATELPANPQTHRNTRQTELRRDMLQHYRAEWMHSFMQIKPTQAQEPYSAMAAAPVHTVSWSLRVGYGLWYERASYSGHVSVFLSPSLPR